MERFKIFIAKHYSGILSVADLFVMYPVFFHNLLHAADKQNAASKSAVVTAFAKRQGMLKKL